MKRPGTRHLQRQLGTAEDSNNQAVAVAVAVAVDARAPILSLQYGFTAPDNGTRNASRTAVSCAASRPISSTA